MSQINDQDLKMYGLVVTLPGGEIRWEKRATSAREAMDHALEKFPEATNIYILEAVGSDSDH